MAMTLLARYRDVEDCTIRYDWRRIAVSGVGSAAITLAGALIGSADVILVKHFFDPDQAGIYSAASLAGKVLLYFVGFVPTVLFRRRPNGTCAASARDTRWPCASEFCSRSRWSD